MSTYTFMTDRWSTSPRNPQQRYHWLLENTHIDGKQQIRLDAVKTRITDLTLQAVQAHGKGRALDIGAGSTHLAAELQHYFSEYITLDIEVRSQKLNIRADGQYLPFGDALFDTVICTDVLEHVPDPWRIFHEVYRVLTPGGVAIMVTPFFFWAHEEPYDFFRISKYGLSYICKQEQLEVLSLQPTCGAIGSFGLLGTVALTKLLQKTPAVLKRVLTLNQVVQTSALLWLDDRIDPAKRFAQGHIVVARKSSIGNDTA